MKGSGQCSFCLDGAEPINAFIYGEDNKIYQDIYESTKRHLQDEITFAHSFDWSNSEGLLSPFCANCFNSAQKIHQTSQELDKIKDILKGLIKLFRDEVTSRNSKYVNQKPNQDLVNCAKYVGPASDLGNLQLTYHGVCDLHNFVEVPSVKVENEEVQVKEEKDDFLIHQWKNVEFPETVPSGNSSVEMPFKTDAVEIREPEYILSDEHVGQQQLPRVVLERIEFDSHGHSKTWKGARKNTNLANLPKSCNNFNPHEFSTECVNPDERKTIGIPQDESQYSDLGGRGKSFKNNSGPRIHSESHNSFFNCLQCEKRFNCRSKMLAHKALHDKSLQNNEECKCKICGKIFKSKINLKLHVRSVHVSSLKRFVCEQCGLNFKKNSLLKYHVDVVHKKIFKHHCKTCGKSFGIVANLKRHEELHKKSSERKRFKCEICGDKYFTQSSTLRVHQKQCHTVFINSRPISCPQCQNEFENSSEFSLHSQNISIGKHCKCIYCDQLFSIRCELLRHTKECHPSQDIPYECKECHIVYNSVKTLNEHSVSQHSMPNTEIKIEIDDNFDFIGEEINKASPQCSYNINLAKKLSCKICGKAVHSKNYLIRHEKHCKRPRTSSAVAQTEKRNNKSNFFECGTCGKNILTQCRKEHEAMHLGEAKITILCPVCGNAYSKKYFARHERQCRAGNVPKKTPIAIKNVLDKLEAEKACSTVSIKTEEGSALKNIHKCNFCNKIFSCPSQVKIHARIHTGEKPYSCNFCGNTFAREIHLKTHLRRHTGEKCFNCDVCGAGFTQSGNLKRHQLTHTGEKPYTCTYCGKSYTQPGTLKIHLRAHTGEKPYTCTFCAKSFADRSSWRKHEKAHLDRYK